jgi:hemoglobin-like flavoprotein
MPPKTDGSNHGTWYGEAGVNAQDRALITEALERAGECVGDITSLVYSRLFKVHPDMEPLFVRDTTGAVKGEMLARVIETILDFTSGRAYADHLIQSEVVTHEGYGVPREIFGTFFAALADTLREILAESWTPAMERSWRTLLEDLDYFVVNPDQRIAAAD